MSAGLINQREVIMKSPNWGSYSTIMLESALDAYFVRLQSFNLSQTKREKALNAIEGIQIELENRGICNV
jgi:hypothetical protein